MTTDDSQQPATVASQLTRDSGALQLACWRVGVLACWRVVELASGVLARWRVGVLACWRVGVLDPNTKPEERHRF